jgi:hypothetical protein
MTYQYAIGFDQSGSLVDVTIQPKSPGILYDRTFGLYPSVYESSGYTIWTYERVLTAEEYVDLLTEFGLTNLLFRECTINTAVGEQVSSGSRAFSVKNAVIVRPHLSFDARFIGPENWYERVEFYFWIY